MGWPDFAYFLGGLKGHVSDTWDDPLSNYHLGDILVLKWIF